MVQVGRVAGLSTGIHSRNLLEFLHQALPLLVHEQSHRVGSTKKPVEFLAYKKKKTINLKDPVEDADGGGGGGSSGSNNGETMRVVGNNGEAMMVVRSKIILQMIWLD